jgi:hypothetical protein
MRTTSASGPPVTLAEVVRIKHELEQNGTLPASQAISRTEEE